MEVLRRTAVKQQSPAPFLRRHISNWSTDPRETHSQTTTRPIHAPWTYSLVTGQLSAGLQSADSACSVDSSALIFCHAFWAPPLHIAVRASFLLDFIVAVRAKELLRGNSLKKTCQKINKTAITISRVVKWLPLTGFETLSGVICYKFLAFNNPVTIRQCYQIIFTFGF